CGRVDLEPMSIADAAERLVAVLSSRAREDQIAVRTDGVYVARLLNDDAEEDAVLSVPPGENWRLVPSASGALEGLELLACNRVEPGPGEVEVHVHTSGLNFRDTLVALGLYPGSTRSLGGEGAGIVTRAGPDAPTLKPGQRVMFMGAHAFSRYLTLPAAQVVALPDAITLEQAATLPIAYLTAWHALHHIAAIAPGERVLVHAAAGGVGHAAIQLARAAGAEVWTTASRSKWQALRAQGVEHIFDSRDP